MTHAFLPFALAICLVPVAGHAQHRQPVAVAKPLTMDVAGVRLGMPFEQAKLAMASSYRCETTNTERTFAEKVEDEVKTRRGENFHRWGGSGVYGMACKGPAGEELQVLFAYGAQCPVVSDINLQIPSTTIDKAALLRQLAAKYGQPPIGSSTHGCWLQTGTFCGLAPKGAMFQIVADSPGVGIFAERGTDAKAADEAAVQAAADRIAPKRSKAAF